jgi:hypothetical protein
MTYLHDSTVLFKHSLGFSFFVVAVTTDKLSGCRQQQKITDMVRNYHQVTSKHNRRPEHKENLWQNGTKKLNTKAFQKDC